ncbi:hypothetical protein J7K91_00080 [bacterium]|nr:hypothetical protein [bacterium]
MFLILNVKSNENINEKSEERRRLLELYEMLSRRIRNPLLLRLKRIGRFFPNFEKGKSLEVEDLSFREFSLLKEVKKDINNLTHQISEEISRTHINSTLREKILGEWMMARQIVKELEKVEEEVKEKIK